MRLLLLGCTGFIGRALVPQLLDSGHHLTIVSRKKPQKVQPSLVHLQTDPSHLNNWNQEKLIDAVAQADGVINFAGEPIAEKRWSKEHCEKIKNSRLRTTQYLINTMAKLNKPPSVLLNASAIGYYGTSQNCVFLETSASGNDFLAKLCQQWEDLSSKKPIATRLIVLLET